jgi:hypothetical protein
LLAGILDDLYVLCGQRFDPRHVAGGDGLGLDRREVPREISVSVDPSE